MCAGDSAEAVNVVMTEISNKRIIVDEQAMTVKADAGIVLHDFLDYLASCALSTAHDAVHCRHQCLTGDLCFCVCF
jgi:hypothetical protein